MKRFIAMLCALALMLSLSVAALAEERSPAIVVEVTSEDSVPAEVKNNLKTLVQSAVDLLRYDSILPKLSAEDLQKTVIKAPGAYSVKIITLKDCSLNGLILTITADDGTVLLIPMEQFDFGFNPETGEITLYFPIAGTFDIIAPVLG